jgi:hypothetical protein
LVVGAAGLVTGCESTTPQQEKVRLIRNNLTPELDTMHQRPDDIDNAIAITFDENGRMLNEDLGRLFLLNRPSRLTPEPTPRP